MKNKLQKTVMMILVVFAISSCNTEYLDPNSTLEPEVVESTDNLIRLINGIQKRWSTERSGVIFTSTHISGLSTNELRLLNPGNLAENDLINGGTSVNGGNEILANLWVNAMLCRKEATTVINAAENTDDVSVANSLKAYGLFYRALVHGTLIQYFEQIPLEIIENAPFKDRATVLENVISDLTTAKQYITDGLSNEVTSGVFSSIDLENTVKAMLARYNNMAGNYDDAIAAANAVDLNVQSTWAFDSANPNPLSFWFGSQNVTQAKDMNFGLSSSLAPDASDKRIPFYVTDISTSGTPDYQVVGFYDDNLDEIPVYLPGEMLLIKAEAYARKTSLMEAVDALNEVLTKKAADDAFGIGADLPSYSGAMTKEAILEEVYKNRRIELYLMGFGIEDSRRFGRAGAGETNAERNRNFYPYPNTERDNNTSTPNNPSS